MALEKKKTQQLLVEPDKKEQVLLLSFDRYFGLLNRPLHHKAGMLAFLKQRAATKRTVAAWKELLKDY